MGVLSLIIKREFKAKVRNKSFIVMTFLSPLLLVAIAFVIGYLSTMKSEVKRIAIHDESGDLKSLFTADESYRYLDKTGVSFNALADSVAAEKFEGVLFIPRVDSINQLKNKIRYISNDSPSMLFVAEIENKIAGKITTENYRIAGLDTTAIRKSRAEVDLKITKTSGEDALKGLNEIKIAIGAAFGYLIMMFIIIYGNMVMRSVIEEKTNRIVEIIISSVKPFQLMMGKIIGTSLAGILQFSIWAVIGVLLLFGMSAWLGVDATAAPSEEMLNAAAENAGTLSLYIRELWELPIATIVISFIIFFVGGYFLYSSFYAAIGAAVDNETDSQQFLLPILMPLILGVYIGFFTVISEPHGTVATVFSLVPLTSPIVMLMRIPFGVPWWQIILSMVLLFGTFLLVVWFSSKIYRIGILMYGKKPTYREIFKWINY